MLIFAFRSAINWHPTKVVYGDFGLKVQKGCWEINIGKSRHGIRRFFIASLKLPMDASLKIVRDFRDFRNHDDCLVIFIVNFV